VTDAAPAPDSCSWQANLTGRSRCSTGPCGLGLPVSARLTPGRRDDLLGQRRQLPGLLGPKHEAVKASLDHQPGQFLGPLAHWAPQRLLVRLSSAATP
jgi:hypothetical protein